MVGTAMERPIMPTSLMLLPAAALLLVLGGCVAGAGGPGYHPGFDDRPPWMQSGAPGGDGQHGTGR